MTPTVDKASLAQVQFRQPQFLIAAAMLNPEDGRSLLSCLLALAFSPLLRRHSLSHRGGGVNILFRTQHSTAAYYLGILGHFPPRSL